MTLSTTAHSEKSILSRNPNLRLIFLSQTISQAGDRMFQIAVVWWVLSQNFPRSGLLVGLLLMCSVLPSVLLRKRIARLIAQTDLRQLLTRADVLGGLFGLGAMVTLAPLFYPGLLGGPLSGLNVLPALTQGELTIATVALGILFASVLFFAACQAHISPALNASVTQVISERADAKEGDLERAVALLTSTTTLSQFIGAALGAFLVGALGVYGVLGLNVLTFFVSRFLDGKLHIKANRAAAPARKLSRTTPVSEETLTLPTAKTVSWQKKKPQVRRMLWLFALVNFFGTPIIVLLPLYVRRVFDLGATHLSVGEALLSLGLLAGALSERFLPAQLRRAERAALVTAVNLFAFGVGLALLPAAPSFSLFCFLLFVITMSIGLMNVRILSYFQNQLDAEDKPAFFADLQATVLSAVPVGIFFVGFASDHFSPQVLSIVQGIAVASLGLTAHFVTRTHDTIPMAAAAATDEVQSAAGGNP